MQDVDIVGRRAEWHVKLEMIWVIPGTIPKPESRSPTHPYVVLGQVRFSCKVFVGIVVHLPLGGDWP